MNQHSPPNLTTTRALPIPAKEPLTQNESNKRIHNKPNTRNQRQLRHPTQIPHNHTSRKRLQKNKQQIQTRKRNNPPKRPHIPHIHQSRKKRPTQKNNESQPLNQQKRNDPPQQNNHPTHRPNIKRNHNTQNNTLPKTVQSKQKPPPPTKQTRSKPPNTNTIRRNTHTNTSNRSHTHMVEIMTGDYVITKKNNNAPNIIGIVTQLITTKRVKIDLLAITGQGLSRSINYFSYDQINDTRLRRTQIFKGLTPLNNPFMIDGRTFNKVNKTDWNIRPDNMRLLTKYERTKLLANLI